MNRSLKILSISYLLTITAVIHAASRMEGTSTHFHIEWLNNGTTLASPEILQCKNQPLECFCIEFLHDFGFELIIKNWWILYPHKRFYATKQFKVTPLTQFPADKYKYLKPDNIKLCILLICFHYYKFLQ